MEMGTVLTMVSKMSLDTASGSHLKKKNQVLGATFQVLTLPPPISSWKATVHGAYPGL